MANVSHNGSLGSQNLKPCENEQLGTAFLTLSDTLALLVGLPVFAKLLWINFTSRKTTDILNFNLALFHSVQYLLCACHLPILYLLKEFHKAFIKTVVVYTQVGGPMSLCFICLERYVAVIHPTYYPLLKTYRWREVCSAAVWLTSVTTTIAVSLPNVKPGHDLKTIPLVLMAVMIDVMMFCTIHIARALKKSGPGQDRLHPVKRRAFVTVCATTAITMFCYIPVTVLQKFGTSEDITYYCIISGLNMLLLSAASVVHPMFYLHTQGELYFCRRAKKGP